MKADNFISFLTDASLLQDISYQELKSMVVQYPYCQNLRYLLVTKSHMDDRNEYETDLHLAATYSIDRNFLFKHLHQEAYTQTSTESLVLEKEPIIDIDIPKEKIAIVAAAPLAKEVLDLSNPIERRTIRIQSENAKLFAEQKAGLTDENAPSANFIEKLEEVEKRIESRGQQPETILDTNHDDIKGNDSSDISTENPVENPLKEDSLVKEQTPESPTIEELFEEETPEENVEAEPITDRSKLITYIEKPEPKESRSVIDQLMKRIDLSQEDELNEIYDGSDLEDELESLPSSSQEKGETPSKHYYEPEVRDVIFEITNDLPGISIEEPIEESSISDEDNFSIEATFEDGDEAPYEEESSEKKEEESIRPEPVPKTSFKDWKEKFLPDPSEDPPSEVSIEAILREEAEEEENQLEAVILEELVEEKEKKKKRKKKKKSNNKKEELKEKKKENSKKKKKKKKKRKIIDIAKKSIRENDDVLSETLADLLVQQGSRKKAIQMYERLSLIFPEKSAFFAEKIEKIKK